MVDLKIGNFGIKRWIVKYVFKRFMCIDCNKTFADYHGIPTKSKYGDELRAFVIYQCIELRLPIITISKSLNKLYSLNFGENSINKFKGDAANSFSSTYNTLISSLCSGKLIHADETKMSLKDKNCFVWILTSMEAVVYIYTETREGEYIQSLLKDFKGVLVSDFYAAYDSIDCPQQKCLIHLIRDINDALYKHPYDNELKQVAESFTYLLKPIVETIDHYGLKKYHLKRHLSSVASFYRKLASINFATETASKIKERLEKNRDVLFTFLQHDGVPWNNNNAEHAVKAFAMLRHIIKGITTEKGLKDYLVLLSICETCKYKGIDFLDFLRSGEKDIDAFVMRSRKKRGSQHVVM